MSASGRLYIDLAYKTLSCPFGIAYEDGIWYVTGIMGWRMRRVSLSSARSTYTKMRDEWLADRAPPDPRDPDHSRPGIFAYHNCTGCSDGARECREGSAYRCSLPHARND